MTGLHRVAGFAVVLGLLTLAITGLVLRLLKKQEPPSWFRGLQYYVENFLIVQAVVGLILFLFLGKRVAGGPLVFLHYFYGSLFPLIAVVSGRIAGIRRKERGAIEYVGWTWGAFFAFGLTTRALMTGLGIGL